MFSFLSRLFRRPSSTPRWTADDERALADAKASHGRRTALAQRKTDAVHDALAHRVWGSTAQGWRGVR